MEIEDDSSEDILYGLSDDLQLDSKKLEREMNYLLEEMMNFFVENADVSYIGFRNILSAYFYRIAEIFILMGKRQVPSLTAYDMMGIISCANTKVKSSPNQSNKIVDENASIIIRKIWSHFYDHEGQSSVAKKVKL